MQPWPAEALIHQARSIRWYLGNMPDAPPEIRIANTGTAVDRPELRINILSDRTRQDGQNHFYWVVTAALTWFGSDEKALNRKDLDYESLNALHWLNTAFNRGEFRGPVIPIRDFSSDAFALTGDFINVDPNTTFTRSLDQYNLFTISGDLRYEVEQSEPQPESPEIESVEWTFNAS